MSGNSVSLAAAASRSCRAISASLSLCICFLLNLPPDVLLWLFRRSTDFPRRRKLNDPRRGGRRPLGLVLGIAGAARFSGTCEAPGVRGPGESDWLTMVMDEGDYALDGVEVWQSPFF